MRVARAVAAALLFAGCAAVAPHAPGGPYYFRSYAPQERPFHGLDELPETEARALDAYCVAWFNSEGRILRAQRWAAGALVSDERYTCSDGEIVSRRWIDGDGVENVEPWVKKKARRPGNKEGPPPV